MKVLGVDPGIHGGLAVVEISDGAAPQLIDAIDIPTVGTGAKERDHARQLDHGTSAAARPDRTCAGHAEARRGFKYGRAVGALEAALACCAIPLTVVEPAAWKKFHQLRGGDKEGGRQRALQLFPSAHTLLARKKDHGRAEASLIALYGARS